MASLTTTNLIRPNSFIVRPPTLNRIHVQQSLATPFLFSSAAACSISSNISINNQFPRSENGGGVRSEVLQQLKQLKPPSYFPLLQLKWCGLSNELNVAAFLFFISSPPKIRSFKVSDYARNRQRKASPTLIDSIRFKLHKPTTTGFIATPKKKKKHRRRPLHQPGFSSSTTSHRSMSEDAPVTVAAQPASNDMEMEKVMKEEAVSGGTNGESKTLKRVIEEGGESDGNEEKKLKVVKSAEEERLEKAEEQGVDEENGKRTVKLGCRTRARAFHGVITEWV